VPAAVQLCGPHDPPPRPLLVQIQVKSFGHTTQKQVAVDAKLFGVEAAKALHGPDLAEFDLFFLLLADNMLKIKDGFYKSPARGRNFEGCVATAKDFQSWSPRRGVDEASYAA